jgi:hypothetical protein
MCNRFLFMILAALPVFAASGPSPCAANPEARQLDYWLGDWSVGTTSAPNTGHGKVFLSLDKCLLTESWGSDTTNHQGENSMAYNPEDKTWYGLFVDNRGRVHALKGAVTPGSAEFTGPSRDENGKVVLNKVKVVRVNQDNVEQIWQKSSNNGASWTTDVRMQYSRKRS